MKDKLVLLMCMSIFLSSSFQLGNATIVDNEPWGEFYTPAGGSLNGFIEVSFNVDGYSNNISIDLYYEDQWKQVLTV